MEEMEHEKRDELILSELHHDETAVKIGFVVLAVAVFILSSLIIYLVFFSPKQISQNILVREKPALPAIENGNPTKSPPSPTSGITNSPTPSPIRMIEKAVSMPKEYFVPFGFGTGQASDWEDVPGLQASVDFDNYQNIKSVVFEVTVNVPTANQDVWVRLYNITDKHPVWYSEVTAKNNTFTASQPIVFDKGKKVYQVQMKTQLSYPANLNLARLHILLK